MAERGDSIKRHKRNAFLYVKSLKQYELNLIGNESSMCVRLPAFM